MWFKLARVHGAGDLQPSGDVSELELSTVRLCILSVDLFQPIIINIQHLR
jgi:hypothetical protein